MKTTNGKKRRAIVGIVGGHREDGPCLDEALRLGRAIAERGYVLMTGGGTGIMRAASEGAALAGGLTVGILPDDRKNSRPGYPNEFIQVPIYTGLGDARNVINALTPDIIIALPGSYGTLSEIVLALKAGTPVISFGAPSFERSAEAPLHTASSVEETLHMLDLLMG